ncbi:MAG: hypothetical protein N2Z22_01915 [Turneriella sp.]|nr:hypothetical protein [Turneriella sp.]
MPALQNLIDSYLNGDGGITVSDIRLQALAEPWFSPYGIPETLDILRRLNAADPKECAEGIALCEREFYTAFHEPDFHLLAYRLYREHGEPHRQQFHKLLCMAILTSILHNRDGRTQATAFSIISLREEYFMLSFLNLEPREQYCQIGKGEFDGQFFDVFTVTPSEDFPADKIYFRLLFDVTRDW